MSDQSRNYCIAGVGGAGRETLICLLDYLAAEPNGQDHTIRFMVDDASFKESEIMGYPVITQSSFQPEECEVIIGIGNPTLRKKVSEALPGDTRFATIIHPTAVISDFVEIGEGSVITAGVIITCNIKIGKHAQVNLNSTIGHDCIIGDYFTTAQGVNISGNCEIGNMVFMGANSCIRQGLHITNHVLVGMGGVVIKNLNDPGTYVGNPVSRISAVAF